jgi:hypothetical protein
MSKFKTYRYTSRDNSPSTIDEPQESSYIQKRNYESLSRDTSPTSERALTVQLFKSTRKSRNPNEFVGGVTVASPFAFRTDHRAQKNAPTEQEENVFFKPEKVFEFKTTNLSPPNLSQSNKLKPITITPEKPVFKARSIPKNVLESTVEIIPSMKKKKIEKIKVLEDIVLTTTVPEPFQLKSQIRHDQYTEKFEESLRTQQLNDKKARCFIANPLPNHNVPFCTKPSSKPLTEVESFELNSDRRRMKRVEFDAKMKQREKELEDFKKELEQEQALQMMETMKKQRKSTVHKATPLPIHDPFVVGKSNEELTVPESPLLITKNRKSRITSI